MNLDQLNQQYMQALNREAQERFEFVLGEGKSSHPLLMLIGEAPGEQEVLRRRPFVGKAGKNLDAFLSVLEIRREDIYITNAVKFRPTKISGKGRPSNRTPTVSEQELFAPWLMEEIGLLAPEIIVTLGNTPLRAVLGRSAVIGECHGRLIREQGKTVFPLYHPAAIIYNRALTEVYQRDLVKLKAFLSMP